MISMNPTFYIDGQDEVVNYSNLGVTDIISIGHKGGKTPGVRHFDRSDCRLHRFEFDDIHELSIWAKTAAPEDWPKEEDIRCLIETFQAVRTVNPNPVFLFHCAAGISRSPAAAFIYLVTLGWNYHRALQEVARVRRVSNGGQDCVHPNILMIKHADNVLNQGGKMLEFMMKELKMEKYLFFGPTLDLERVRLWYKVK